MKKPFATRTTGKRGEVLVAIVNKTSDFDILANKLLYRVPVDSAPKRWPPEWMAFYLTKVFGSEAYAVRHFGRVKSIRRVRRTELFPDELRNQKSNREYYQVFLSSLEPLANPIPSLSLEAHRLHRHNHTQAAHHRGGQPLVRDSPAGTRYCPDSGR